MPVLDSVALACCHFVLLLLSPLLYCLQYLLSCVKVYSTQFPLRVPLSVFSSFKLGGGGRTFDFSVYRADSFFIDNL